MEYLDALRSLVDGWTNRATGLGTSLDRSTYGRHDRDWRLDDSELISLFESDDISRRIVSLEPSECMRQGYSLACPSAPTLRAWADGVDLDREFSEAWTWGRLFGGALLVLGVDDGQDPSQALDARSVRSLRWVKCYDKRFATVAKWYTSDVDDPRPEKLGRPEVYLVTEPVGGGGSYHIHESRTVRFGGAMTDDVTRYGLGGWDQSVLRVVYNTIRQFNSAFQATDFLLSDQAQGILTIKGLIGALASGKKDLITSRVELLDLTRGMLRSMLLDADAGESYTRIVTPLSGLGDVLDRVAYRLGAATGIPATVLLGRSPAGLSATGESDIRTWYDRLRTVQVFDAEPRLLRIYQLAARALGCEVPSAVTWPSLWQETPKETAETAKLRAETDAAYIAAEVLSPDDVRAMRYPHLADVDAPPPVPRVTPRQGAGLLASQTIAARVAAREP